MIGSETVKQIFLERPVSEELEKMLEVVQKKWGYKVLNVIETKVPNGGHGWSDQAFIIIYDTGEDKE